MISILSRKFHKMMNLRWSIVTHLMTASVLCLHCEPTLNLTELASLDLRPGCKGMSQTLEPQRGHRYFSSNHKTGTVLASCLRKHLRDLLGVRVDCLSKHATGGFSPDAYQVNFVRDPFRLVLSAYRYHQNTSEQWSLTGFQNMRRDLPSLGHWQGAREAYNVWSRWCNVTRAAVSETASYSSALRSLPFDDGVLFESLRSLYRDVPYVLSSAKECYLSNKRHAGSCRNIIMDDFVASIDSRIRIDLADALNLTGATHFSFSALSKVAAQCNPKTIAASSGKTATHITSILSDDKALMKDLERLRYLDRHFLDNQLLEAANKLNDYVFSSE